jgi:hypothetical protein
MDYYITFISPGLKTDGQTSKKNFDHAYDKLAVDYTLRFFSLRTAQKKTNGNK